VAETQNITPNQGASGPKGMVLYAIGDVHGRADLLRTLLEKVHADADATVTNGVQPILLFVGDYIDRGPDSRGVLDLILGERERGRFRLITLRGNHDVYLLNFLDNGETGPLWMNVGGSATLMSYGVSPPRLQSDAGGWREASAELAAAMPQSHVDLLQDSGLMATFNDYVFVHAGVKPGVPLDQQLEEDVLTIRRRFLSAKDPAMGKVVVFGHTPFDEPYIRSDKIGIDTGAFSSGVLTALRIEGTRRSVIQTSRAQHAPASRTWDSDRGRFSKPT
jgi:serine/threonine protein phosphatase 1